MSGSGAMTERMAEAYAAVDAAKQACKGLSPMAVDKYVAMAIQRSLYPPKSEA